MKDVVRARLYGGCGKVLTFFLISFVSIESGKYHKSYGSTSTSHIKSLNQNKKNRQRCMALKHKNVAELNWSM